VIRVGIVFVVFGLFGVVLKAFQYGDDPSRSLPSVEVNYALIARPRAAWMGLGALLIVIGLLT
jgi:hypothetical protein